MVILLKIKRRTFFQRGSIPILVSRTMKTRKFKKAEKICLETGLPPAYLKVWMTAPPPPASPLPEGLDPPLYN